MTLLIDVGVPASARPPEHCRRLVWSAERVLAAPMMLSTRRAVNHAHGGWTSCSWAHIRTWTVPSVSRPHPQAERESYWCAALHGRANESQAEQAIQTASLATATDQTVMHLQHHLHKKLRHSSISLRVHTERTALTLLPLHSIPQSSNADRREERGSSCYPHHDS